MLGLLAFYEEAVKYIGRIKVESATAPGGFAVSGVVPDLCRYPHLERQMW